MRSAQTTRRRLGPGFTVALLLAGLAIVTLRAVPAPTQASDDSYYFDAKPVSLRRSQTEVVARFIGGANVVSRMAQRAPGLRVAAQTVAEGRDYQVLSLPLQALVKGQRQTNAPIAEGTDVNQLLAALRQDPDVEFVAPVFHYPATGIRILPTDEVTVRLKPGDTRHDLEGVASSHGLVVDRTLDGTSDVFILRMVDPKGPNALDVSRALFESGRFQWAEPNLIQEYQHFDTPNDPLYGAQWHLKNTGQSGGFVGADSKLDQAWDIQAGSSSIIIAVVDDGMEKTHEDLSANLFVNPGEIAANGIDDDVNGKIDDVSGWDFSNNDNNVTPTAVEDNHGTSVAGVAAARGNNSIGVTGACRVCKILPVKIFEAGIATTDTAIANALTYAASFAHVINNSWGGGPPSASIQTAIANANTNGRGGKGAIVMFATGNSASGFGMYSISSFPSGNFGFQFIYSKDTTVTQGDDTAWVAWMQMPGGQNVNFESGIPAGWTTGGSANWTFPTDATHTDEGRCFVRAAKAGTIGNSQTTYLQALNKAVTAGTFYAYVWTSSEANFDFLKINIDTDNDGTFDFNAFNLSGVPPVTMSVAYPAKHPESIAVGASSNYDCRSHYSEFGPEVAFVAPSSAGPYNLAITTTDRTGAAGYDAGSNYTNAFGGTSSATPLASGIAGLLLSRSPNLPRANVLSILQSTADKVGPQAYVSGRNDRYGYGRLNAYAALQNTPVVPGAPTNVGGVAGNAQVSVSFLPPASNGGSAITQYKATSSPGGLFNTGASSPIVVGGLTNGVSYTFTVTATNIAGTGPASAPTNSVTPVAPPAAFGKSLPGNGVTGVPLSPVLNWNAASGATGYEVCIDTSNNNACNSTWVNVGNQTSWPVGVLPASTAHYWHVRANNAGGQTYADGGSTAFWSFTTGVSTGPFGQMDSPLQNAAGVQGAIAVTGWALDDIGVNKVEIFRNCLGGFDAPNCQTVLATSLVYIGDAAFLDGARPDVAAAFQTYPLRTRAGWGYLMLTSMLPHVPNSQPFGGQGPLTIYAIATDTNGNKKILGRSFDSGSPDYSTPTAITMANDTIAKPFGAIDTPGQGQTVSGILNNFGWALTPDLDTVSGNGAVPLIPAGTGILIPVNGSTMIVYIDGAPWAQVTYNQCRGTVGNPVPPGVFCNDDVANIFGNPTPQASLTTRLSNPTKFRNLDAQRGAIGSYSFNTNSLSDGLHTIAWSVTDSAARNEGIGSRFFIVQNASGPSPVTSSITPAMLGAQAKELGSTSKLDHYARASESVWGRAGFDLASSWTKMQANDDGTFAVRLTQLGRLELWLGDEVEAGYMVAGDELHSLPVGASLAGPRFAWMPPAGYIGPYHLVFVRGGERVDVTVTVVEKAGAHGQDAQVRMQLDAASVAPAGLGHEGERLVRIAGWAFDPEAQVGSGITSVQVWATPERGGPDSAVFLGTAELGHSRPDLSHQFPEAPGHAGFSLAASLKPGTYTVTAYAWNERTGRWEDSRSAQVVVR